MAKGTVVRHKVISDMVSVVGYSISWFTIPVALGSSSKEYPLLKTHHEPCVWRSSFLFD